MSKLKDITNQRFGRLLVMSNCKERTPLGAVRWLCKCDCGNKVSVVSACLRNGSSKSCGCLRTELTVSRSTKHGCATRACATPEYRAWVSMKRRCYLHTDISYKNYGGRGITVCSRWVNSFGSFLNDMGHRPSKQHSVDRISNHGNYTPKNCKWSTKHEQMNNTRYNHLIKFNGRTQNLTAWANEIGISPGTLWGRLKRWTIEESLTTPLRVIDK